MDDDEEYFIHSIVGHRWQPRPDAAPDLLYKLKWAGYATTTFEPLDNIPDDVPSYSKLICTYNQKFLHNVCHNCGGEYAFATSEDLNNHLLVCSPTNSTHLTIATSHNEADGQLGSPFVDGRSLDIPHATSTEESMNLQTERPTLSAPLSYRELVDIDLASLNTTKQRAYVNYPSLNDGNSWSVFQEAVVLHLTTLLKSLEHLRPCERVIKFAHYLYHFSAEYFGVIETVHERKSQMKSTGKDPNIEALKKARKDVNTLTKLWRHETRLPRQTRDQDVLHALQCAQKICSSPSMSGFSILVAMNKCRLRSRTTNCGATHSSRYWLWSRWLILVKVCYGPLN